MPRIRAASSSSRAVLLLCLAAAGCMHAHRVAQHPDPPSLLPLAAGNEWIYEVRNPAGEVSKLTMRVRGPRYIASRGMEATIVEESGGVPGEPSLDSGTDLVAYYLRGGFLFRSPWIIRRKSMLEDRGAELGDEALLPVDLRQKPTWESRYGLFDFARRPVYEIQARSSLASASEPVVVPAAVFERCVRIDTTVSIRSAGAPVSRTIVHHYADWYAPGVGLVKSESFVDDGGTKRKVGVVTLVRFFVKGRS